MAAPPPPLKRVSGLHYIFHRGNGGGGAGREEQKIGGNLKVLK